MHATRRLIPALILLILLSASSGLAAAPAFDCASTSEILLTSAAGDKLTRQENVDFVTGAAAGTVIRVYPDKVKQTIDGIGTSFTESSAFVLAHLDRAKRREVMENIFGSGGANFSLARTHIGACDFSVKGRYSYADVPGDAGLAGFTIEPDLEGFDPSEYPGLRDASYDLLPMIREALAVKGRQKDQGLRIVASAWTAPAWMKDIGTWYIPGAPENNWQGTGGSLKQEYETAYADYLVKYLQAYQAEGVDIWGLTPVNEPHGNNGQWESMNFTPGSQRDFIRNHLGPKLRDGGFAGVRLLTYDQNRDGLEEWTDVVYADPETTPYLYGAAIHWYESTFRVYEDVLDRVHAKNPGMAVMHTEGCIDDLGKDPPGGVTDPAGFKESGWFGNDSFWWSKTATDWAYSVTWEGVKVEDHPMYTPVHRYSRNLIESLDHWVTGWIDWNIVLDRRGGPNHVGNFCGAPIMIDTDTKEVYYTPIYHVLSQFSRSIRPGDKAVLTEQADAGLGDDDLHSCATLNGEGLLSVQLLNTTQAPIAYKLQIGSKYAELTVAANAVQTVRVQLSGDLQ
jgi:glucosylceramidase